MCPESRSSWAEAFARIASGCQSGADTRLAMRFSIANCTKLFKVEIETSCGWGQIWRNFILRQCLFRPSTHGFGKTN